MISVTIYLIVDMIIFPSFKFNIFGLSLLVNFPFMGNEIDNIDYFHILTDTDNYLYIPVMHPSL